MTMEQMPLASIIALFLLEFLIVLAGMNITKVIVNSSGTQRLLKKSAVELVDIFFYITVASIAIAATLVIIGIFTSAWIAACSSVYIVSVLSTFLIDSVLASFKVKLVGDNYENKKRRFWQL